MKKVLLCLVCFMVFGMVGCNQDDTVTPPVANIQYTANLITNSGGTMGMSATVEYAGQMNGYLGEMDVNIQTHDIYWMSQYGSDVVVTIIYYTETPAGDVEFATYRVCYDYTEKVMNGIATKVERSSGGGWLKVGDAIYTVQLDGRF